MIIKPRVRGFISVSAHPLGCAAHVRQQVAYVQARAPLARGPARVLVIGASTGYGLAARIAAGFGARAATLGVFLEREGAADRPATAGWYNSAAFEQQAHAAGLYARSINGDAFSDAVKQRTIDTLRADLGQVDLVIYSLAAPRRTHPVSGRVFASTLKPIGQPLQARTIDTDRQVLRDSVLEPATPEEIEGTIAVMGGEDWQMWIDALAEAGVLAPGAKTSAFTYLGDEITRAIYWDGSIGAAKKDLDRRVLGIREQLSTHGGDARVSVLKALVTQASAAIPMMPLYLSLLFKAMKEQGTHEGCIEQVVRLFETGLYGAAPQLDAEGRLRVDDLELDPRVQQRVQALWQQVSDDNLRETTDFAGYQADFLRLFGFGFDGIDYEAEVDPAVPLAGVVQVA